MEVCEGEAIGGRGRVVDGTRQAKGVTIKEAFYST